MAQCPLTAVHSRNYPLLGDIVAVTSGDYFKSHQLVTGERRGRNRTVVIANQGYPFQSTYAVTRTVYPTLTRANQVVRLSRRGDERLANVAMVDLRISRAFAIGGVRRFTPQLEIFNLGNASTVVRNTPAAGTLYLAPAEILAPRVVKVRFVMTF